ncbi:hypothetical protein KP509_36G016900 [Ceratopteris richardii]|uniref:Uncharacterized protein n=1 Tax=Ceratopteris richardii TaxID=49495 RepID=A0A8T2QA23_CERRI|nr:hypothetical protein KP509_36G016900 [Ceratopteris richardii]
MVDTLWRADFLHGYILPTHVKFTYIFFSNMRMQTFFQCHLCTTLCTSIIWLLVMGLDTAIYMWQDLPNAMENFPRLCSCSHTSNMHLQMYSLMKQNPRTSTTRRRTLPKIPSMDPKEINKEHKAKEGGKWFQTTTYPMM